MILAEGTIFLIAAIALVLAFQIWQNPIEPSTPKQLSGCQETIEIGQSLEGIKIEACQLAGSTSDAKNTLLVIGTVHGDEPDGMRIVDEMVEASVPMGTNIWVIRDANPDGSSLATRRNANGVDLNRNFPVNWVASDPAARTYSGPSPASEPETLALMNAVRQIQPTRIVIFHQPFEQIDCPPERPTTISDRLSQLTGYKSECIPGEKSGSPTNTYTGTFTIWVNSTFPETTAVTFELGITTMDSKIETIAKALRVLASGE
jgi:hypothetical protein